MKNIIKNSISRTLTKLIALLKESKTIRNLLSDTNNVDEFTDIGEHERMIADPTRVDNYHKAISKHINAGDVVLDLGTGTGILSYFAAQQSPKKIYGVDHSEFISVAKKIAEHNKIENMEFVNQNSRSFDPGEKVDVILHEQIGSALFDENMVENILDLRDRLLKEGGRILPGKFEFYIEPISFKREFKIPYIWEKNIHGVDFSFLKDFDEIKKYKKDGYENVFPDPESVKCFLCEPEPLVSFDLEKLKSPDDLPKSWNIEKTVVNEGEIDAFCIYFRIIFDDDIEFDTSPFSTRTHWGQPAKRVKCREFKVGDKIAYDIKLGDLVNTMTWSVDLK